MSDDRAGRLLARMARLARLAGAILATTLASACGSGSGSGGPGLQDRGAPAPASSAAPQAALALAACQPSGIAGAVDHAVGPGQRYTELDQVPWESLKAGDTVRILPRPTPYKGKFMISAQGTAQAPVRICGVRNSLDERPTIDGHGAVARRALAPLYANTPADRDIHEGRSIIVIKHDARAYTGLPSHIQIDGLHLTRAHPDYAFVDSGGNVRNYLDFGAAIWVERGHHITLADNEITDSQMAVFTKSNDDSIDQNDFTVTQDIRIAGNDFSGMGIGGSDRMHTTYTASQGIVIEFNRYRALRSGAGGNSIKDRSSGTVVRYNLIEAGAHAIDLVEAEDFPRTATRDPAYRLSHVYGNVIVKSGDTGSVIHYGGDHYGSAPGGSWGEPNFRKGTLYFFHNTLVIGGGSARLFQLATTEETAQVWNNVFVMRDSVSLSQRNVRQSTDLNGSAWTPGGIVELGQNWISTGWQDSDADHAVPGALNGTANLRSGTTSPLDPATLVPLAGSVPVDAAQAGVGAAAGITPVYQISVNGRVSARTRNGAALDMGALER
ncbi:right-handed parallel beta-helix repeat-containing protein [Leptothrix discophora]|uniref:Right handed beta helix domain-containing protein n=1 Tax=Leptothrix discophora TaxID=89 RepID=A0ABT9G0F1_LEPDI|nr:hypothetical protein [Leptothrix discophora]MDP4299895.1 hypothetical protein [Leptothrix discophora]